MQLLKAIGDAAAGQVIRRQLDQHPISRQDLNEVQPDLARDMRQDLVAVRQFNLEHGVRQRLPHHAFDFNRVFLRHKLLYRRRSAPTSSGRAHSLRPYYYGSVSTSASPSVIAIV